MRWRFAWLGIPLTLAFFAPQLAPAGGGGGGEPSPFLNPKPPVCEPGGPVNWRPLIDSLERDSKDLENWAERHIVRPTAKYGWSKVSFSDEIDYVKDIFTGCE